MNGKEEHYPDYPLFKGLQRPLEFMGYSGSLHLLGGSHDRHRHCRLHHSLLYGRIRPCPDCPVRHRDKRCGTDSVQAAQGTAQQTAGTWGVHLCLLKENVTENHLTMNGYIEC